jgi:hypothetical protein
MKGKVGRCVFVAAAAIQLVFVLYGVATADPPATWDYDDVNYAPLVEGTDWAILGQSQIAARFGNE